jgi:hypothetical protein
VIPYQQINVRHRTLAGRVELQLMQGRAFEGDECDSGAPPRVMQLLQQLSGTHVPALRVHTLIIQESSPAGRPLPA